MNSEITGKNTLRITARVKPYQTPAKIDKESDFRKGIPLTLDVTVKDIGDFDLSTMPKAVATRFAKSVTIELQNLFRVAPKDAEDIAEYESAYKKLAKLLEKPQVYEIGDVKERKSAGPRQTEEDRAAKAVMEYMGIFMQKYPKQFEKDAIMALSRLREGGTAAEVKEIATQIVMGWDAKK